MKLSYRAVSHWVLSWSLAVGYCPFNKRLNQKKAQISSCEVIYQDKGMSESSYGRSTEELCDSLFSLVC